MELKEYQNKNKIVYDSIDRFIEDEDKIEENYQNLIKSFYDFKIADNKYEIQSILYVLSNISNNHHRSPSFFPKIEQIILHFKSEIKKFFSNFEIFSFFQTNQMIILFLINEGIITVDQTIANIIINNNFSDFLYPEIKQFQKIIPDLPENFEEKRRIGENEHKICEIIRKDSINEFVSYYNNLNTTSNEIETSIFETNSFLIEHNKPSLIEYAAFHGSIKIFTFLRDNDFELKPSIWLYAIHGNNLELIKEINVKPLDESFNMCLKEAIKCHHNTIALYIMNNLMNDSFFYSSIENNFENNILSFCLQFHNYNCFENDLSNYKFGIFYLCKYNYVTLVKLLLKSQKLNLNEKVIFFLKIFIMFSLINF